MNKQSESCLAPEPRGIPSWSLTSRRELIDLYLRKMSLNSLSEHFDTSPREIVRELAKLILGVTDAYENKFAENFGTKWDLVEEEKLHVYFRRGHSVPGISRLLNRDRLGSCFRILANFDVVIPERTRMELKLDEYWANETDQNSKEHPTRICVVCEDVIVYCKCQFEDWGDPFR